MKKYKHKATGAIAEENNHFMCYIIKHERLAESMIDRKIIENSNDWELVESSLSRADTIKLSHKEEPNYLITAFRAKDGSVVFITKKMSEEPMYGGGIKQKDFLKGENSLEDGQWEIFKVKNSLGEEFTIGDKVTDKVECFIIESFDLNEAYIDGCFARGKGDGRLVGCSIWLLEKVKKQPIYTTTDGVEVMKGDNIRLFLLNSDLNKETTTDVYVSRFTELDADVASRFLTFTSEENRDKYIKENSKKPVFVSADGKEMFEGYRYYVPQIDLSDKLTGTYLEFTTDTRTVSHGPKKFSTKSAAQEYIDNNKPRFSLADIKKVHDDIYGIGDVYGVVSALKKLGK